jgi:hypothetical protein
MNAVTALRQAMLNPRLWTLLTILLMFVARCDDFSTYPK